MLNNETLEEHLLLIPLSVASPVSEEPMALNPSVTRCFYVGLAACLRATLAWIQGATLSCPKSPGYF